MEEKEKEKELHEEVIHHGIRHNGKDMSLQILCD